MNQRTPGKHYVQNIITSRKQLTERLTLYYIKQNQPTIPTMTREHTRHFPNQMTDPKTPNIKHLDFNIEDLCLRYNIIATNPFLLALNDLVQAIRGSPSSVTRICRLTKSLRITQQSMNIWRKKRKKKKKKTK